MRPLDNARHETFVQLVAAGKPQSQAYVEAGYAPGGARQNASRLMTNDNIIQRVRYLKNAQIQALSAELKIDAAWVKQQYLDVVMADPNDLLQVIVCACRHCHGVGHAYQWRDPLEFENALRDWQALPDTLRAATCMPDDAGGHGWSRKLSPHAECPRCDGFGTPEFLVKDSAGHPLYAGCRQTSHGVTIRLHDKLAALKQLGRILGAFKDDKTVMTDGDRVVHEFRDLIAKHGRGPVFATHQPQTSTCPQCGQTVHNAH